ncbi:unnamed protein product [Candidula unifasciata]|uniref:Kazal-like domain-containing protein n=1 Tax=Candidula unifasciata TaxID=100452 RepID=A0A8S3Z6T5_9EUPU|nr:unnamed protein product [Candidula unifasciata]
MKNQIYKPVQSNGHKASNKTKDYRNDQTFDEETSDSRCGVSFVNPALLQPCANIGVFSLFFSLAALTTSTLSTYVTSQVTTLERQFGFTSHQTGIIMAANDIGYLVCVLFVSYSASRLHIPRSLGIATVLFGVSGLACSLPHFIFGAPSAGDLSSDTLNVTLSLASVPKKSSMFGALCDPSNSTSDSCEALAGTTRSSSSLFTAPEKVAKASLVIIVIGMMIQGFGKAPRTSLTVTYIDDNTSNVNTGFYMGIIATLGHLGPAVAFLMGGVFSKMYVTLQPTNLTPYHPRWIGAWWLGYVLFGTLALFVSLPLFCFPHRLPGQDFLTTICGLLINPVYMCLVISSCFLVFTMGGTSSYIPKYLERMFHLPAHTANYIIAGQVLCAGTLGTFVGGYLSKRMTMTAMKALKFVIVVVTIAFACQLLGFAFQCEQPKVHNWPGEDSSCSSECNCQDNSYFPICGGDGLTYYSPCHAGCGQMQNRIYQNCTCIPGGLAYSGTCDYSCGHLYPYVAVMGVRSLFGSLSMIPKMVLFIRCVSHKDRALALGFSSFLMSLLGWLLGPIVFGNVIDGICTIWDVTCEVQGRCLRYDNSLFRLKIHGFGAVGVACSLACIVVAYVYARWTRCLDEPQGAKGQIKETTAAIILMGTLDDVTQEQNAQDTTERGRESPENVNYRTTTNNV